MTIRSGTIRPEHNIILSAFEHDGTDSGADESEIALLRSLHPDLRIMEAETGSEARLLRSTS